MGEEKAGGLILQRAVGNLADFDLAAHFLRGPDAEFHLNGIDVKQPSNTINNVAPGVFYYYTRVTVTASIPWPTLSMSNLILSPAEMLATDVTLMLAEPAGASAPR